MSMVWSQFWQALISLQRTPAALKLLRPARETEWSNATLSVSIWCALYRKKQTRHFGNHLNFETLHKGGEFRPSISCHMSRLDATPPPAAVTPILTCLSPTRRSSPSRDHERCVWMSEQPCLVLGASVGERREKEMQKNEIEKSKNQKIKKWKNGKMENFQFFFFL